MSASVLTVLHAPNVIAAKGAGKLHFGFLLSHDAIPVDSFETMVMALEGLKPVSNAYVVRGKVAEGAPELVRRRHIAEPFHIVDTPQQWLCVDIDGRQTAINAFTEPARAVGALRASLPGGLSQAACYYALTGSCKPHMIHAHLWFWLDRSYSNAELKRDLTGKCDCSLYKPTQPHFTAAPLIPDDAIAATRRGILLGDEGWLGRAPSIADPEAATAQLLASMNDIVAQTKGNRHKTVNGRAFHMGKHVASGAIDRYHVIETLVSAAVQAGLPADRARDEVCRALADGIEAAPLREAWVDRLETNKDGVPRSSYLNSVIALSDSGDWHGCLGYSERHARTEWLRDPPVASGYPTARQGAPFRDEHAAVAAEWLGRHGLSYARGAIIDTMMDVSHKNPFDPLKDLLDELDWDGKPRLGTMLLDYFGVDATKAQWAEAIGRRWMIAAIARVYERGCKADNVLVLEGAQGKYKSTALDILGMGYTKELRVRLDDKDASDALHAGAWIAVLTELDAFKGTARVESVKAFLTMVEDHYRRAYGRVTQSFQRSIVFAATTNEDNYLNDPTGNRRFWPVRCGKIDVQALTRDCEQLWAEAKQAHFDGEPWHLDRDELIAIAETEQAARLLPDSWEEYADEYLLGKDFVTLREICVSVYDLDPAQQTTMNTARIQRYLKRRGFRPVIRTINNNKRVKGYERT